MSRNQTVPEWTLHDGTDHEDCDESPCDECAAAADAAPDTYEPFFAAGPKDEA